MTIESKGQSTGQPNQQPEITLASWGRRFVAWLIDFIIVNGALGVLFAAVSMPMWLYGFTNPRMMAPIYGNAWWNGFGGPFSYAITSLVFFGYWTYMESKSGQSVGKMLLRIKTTNLEGKPADMRSIVISSFGKAFLLPIDVFFGWIFTNEKRQRLFSRASNTIVIRPKNTDNSESVTYRKE